MTRREVLTKSALLMGGVLSAGTLTAILQGCKADPSTKARCNFLSSPEAKLVAKLADIIVPKTHTPSAVEVGVPAFIFLVLEDCFPATDREKFARGLRKMNDLCKEKTGKTLLQCEPHIREDFLKIIDRETRSDKASPEEKPEHLYTWRLLKELTITGYFTSEIGATEVLEYLPVPGRIDGCMELKPGQKTWAI